MKKLLSLTLILAVLISATAAFTVDASAAGNTLVITSNGARLGEVEVGNLFIYSVALDSAGYNVEMAQAELRYDPAYVSVVEYGPDSDGDTYMDAYSFPERILNTNLVTNYYALDKQVSYNFAKKGGVGSFKPSDHYFKLRFKVKKAGTVDISHYFNTLNSVVDGKYVRLIYNDKGSDKLDPTPFAVSSVDPAKGLIGDADGDYSLTVMDATLIQRLTAGVQTSYNMFNADVNNDGEINLRDALAILRHRAGTSTGTKVGEWVFESEE